MTDKTTAQDIVLRLNRITKRFGSLTANDGISFELRRGEVIALLHVQQHLSCRRSVSRENRHIGGQGHGNVVDLQAHQKRCRIAHKSGKKGWKRLFLRNSTPSEPPVPSLVPMVRETNCTWR